MVGSRFRHGIGNGVSGGDDSFDKILNILDFPMESLEGDGLDGDWVANFQRLAPIASEAFPGLPQISQVNIGKGTLEMPPPESSVPSDRTSLLKQLPNFVEEISSNSIPLDSSDGKESGMFQAPSPISVPESGSSCLTENSMSISRELSIPLRTRSKRSRPLTSNPWLMTSPISFASSKKILNPIESEVKKTKEPSKLLGAVEIKEDSLQRYVPTKKCCHCEETETPQQRAGPMGTKRLCNARGVRSLSGRFLPRYRLAPHPTFVATKKCSHCGVTKTPQWRAGPMGPKELCNACGVRYRSGRLLPEYRPAASPTFVPSLHSNSHKKVIEMRNKTIQEEAMDEMDPAMSPPPEFVPMSTYLFDRV